MSASKKILKMLPGRSFAIRSLRYFRRVLARHFGPRVHTVQTYSDSEFLKLLEFDASNRNSVSELLRHYDQRMDGKWPSIPNALTDLRIDMSRMTDEEIIERADGALTGDLHPSGLRPIFTEK